MVGVAQIILQNPEALFFLPLLWLLFVLFSWRRRFRPFGAFLLRLGIIVLVTLALAHPVLLPPAAATPEKAEQTLILLVDQSASLGQTGQQLLRAEAARLAQALPKSQTIYFANQPIVATASTKAPTENLSLPAQFDPNQTNLAEAFSLGLILLNHQPGRLVVLSDGLANQGDTTQALAALSQRQIPVDVLLLDEATTQSWQPAPNEVRLTRLSLPPTLRQGETFGIEVTLHSQTAGQVQLNLTQADQLLAEDVITLQPGANPFTFEAKADTLGPQVINAIVAANEGQDGEASNNRLGAFTQVYPPPQLLVVSDDQGPAGRFTLQLRQAGFVVDRLNPVDLPTRLSELEAYAGMVLVNVSARSFELEQMITIQEFVRSLGRGLLVTGGRDSFSLGAYQNTPLEELLPVSLEPPPREERPPVALLLIIDHSGSMMEKSEPVTKLAMAKEAAIRATNILGPQDLIGVLMFDNTYVWVIPFQQVSDGAALLDIQQRIARIPGGGGTRILQALDMGLPALAQQQAASAARHAVLLTDGKSFDGVEGVTAYDQVVEAALEADITLSTIAIGQEADQELLAYLAEKGRGRYHFAPIPEELPELTIAESDILRSNAVQEGEFQPSVFAPHPMLRGLFTTSPVLNEATLAELPSLAGYLAQTPKSRAEIALQVGPGDPLLTVWGYGLGRVAAWTADTGQEWAADWQAWAKAGQFWGQVIGYTLPTPGLGLLQLEAEVDANGVATLTATGLTATGQTVDLARTEASLTTPAGREIPITLRQVAPGRYQQRLRLPDPGVYQLTASQSQPNEPEETATIGFVVAYPPEFALPAEGAGQTLLQQLAATSGGRTFSLGVAGCTFLVNGCQSQEVAPAPSDSSFIELWQANLQNLETELELWPGLLLAALCLWPLEIAWRRWGRLRIQ
jgi:uncharacterized membrane protein